MENKKFQNLTKNTILSEQFQNLTKNTILTEQFQNFTKNTILTNSSKLERKIVDAEKYQNTFLYLVHTLQ